MARRCAPPLLGALLLLSATSGPSPSGAASSASSGSRSGSGSLLSGAPPPPPPPKLNVLVVAIDDLRPETEPYGFSHMSTPHFAKFAASATVFERAYVAVALCMPSRTAILTSRRADTTMDWDVRRAAPPAPPCHSPALPCHRAAS